MSGSYEPVPVTTAPLTSTPLAGGTGGFGEIPIFPGADKKAGVEFASGDLPALLFHDMRRHGTGAAADKMDDFQAIAILDRRAAVSASRHNFKVALHGDLARIETEPPQHGFDAQWSIKIARLSIDLNLHSA